ncbi:MAG: DNA/RNA non-specific endonuclease [Gemmobacter sp.]
MPPVTDAQIADYLRGLMPSGTLDEAVARAAAGPEFATAAMRPDRMRAIPDTRLVLEKLARARPLDRDERFHLEAIILPDQRPAIDILNGSYAVLHPLWLDLDEAGVRARLEARFPTIGRIDVPGDPRIPYAGTGFVVGPNLLMTNRHVAQVFTAGVGRQGLRFLPGLGAGVDFRRERHAPDAPLLRLAAPVMIHPYWDMALLTVEGLPEAVAPLALSPEPAEALAGRRVAVVGFPAFDPRNPADVQMEVFGGVFGVKRLQPGRITGTAPAASIAGTVPAMLHDASTLGGNSGSCLIDLATGAVLGLHFGGRYLVTNHAVPAGALVRDGRVVDAGVQVAGTVPEPGGPWDDAWAGAERAGDDPPAAPAPAPAAGPAAGPAQVVLTADGAARITLPLEITVRIGTAPVAGLSAAPLAVAPPAAAEAERVVEPYRHRDYADRPGYDPDFIGAPVPMPVPRDPARVLTLPDSGHVLPYYHFSVVMDARRRLALLTAANVDGSAAMRRPENRPEGDYSRKGLAGMGPRDTERWFPDPRLPPEAQLPDRFYMRDRGSFDRGHIVRRDDVAWGATYEEMRRANGDTFHVTNCSPQTKAFNQAPHGTDNWGDLEVLVEQAARTERLCVLGGPVLAADDPVFAGVDDAGAVAVPIPVRFWKAIAANGDGGLQVFAFLLEQDLTAVQWEFAVPDRWRRFLVPLAQIEALTGLDFARNLREADQHGQAAGRRLCDTAGIDRAPAPPDPPGVPAALPPTVRDLIAFWKGMQAGDGGTTPAGAAARFVATLTAPVGDETLAAELTAATGLALTVGPLFGPGRETDRFRLITVTDVLADDRADLFDFARALRDLTGAETVEPDLGSDYFDDDRSTAPPEGSAESADWAFWCWVKETQQNLPSHPDWAAAKARVAEAWAFSAAAGRPARGRGIVIAQPDTGVAKHREVPDAWKDDPKGANFVEGGRPVDPMTGGNDGHGTATGSVAASPEAGAMAGSAPAARLVPIRAIRAVTVFDQSRVAQAIDHARRTGAHVVTLSLGGLFSTALHQAVRLAVAQNVIVVAAAGNCVGEVVWPARYDEVIAVAGVNERDQPWKGSCRGPAVDIAGPAEFVLRADARDPADPGKVGGGQGTSFATAQLAGVAACWLAHHGRDALIARLPRGMTLQALFHRALRASARRPAGFDTARFGAGIVDARALLALDLDGVMAGETVEPPPRNTPALVGELVAATLGTGGLEAVARVADDPQSLLELACLAFDRARFAPSRRAAAEAPPMPGLSAGLHARIGRAAAEALRGAGTP